MNTVAQLRARAHTPVQTCEAQKGLHSKQPEAIYVRMSICMSIRARTYGPVCAWHNARHVARQVVGRPGECKHVDVGGDMHEDMHKTMVEACVAICVEACGGVCVEACMQICVKAYVVNVCRYVL